MAGWHDRGQPRYLLKPATIGSTQLAEVLNFAPSNASIMKQTPLNHPGDPEDQAGVEALRVAFNGIVKLNSILFVGVPGRGRATLFLLMNRRRARRDSKPKIAYTYLP